MEIFTEMNISCLPLYLYYPDAFHLKTYNRDTDKYFQLPLISVDNIRATSDFFCESQMSVLCIFLT